MKRTYRISQQNPMNSDGKTNAAAGFSGIKMICFPDLRELQIRDENPVSRV